MTALIESGIAVEPSPFFEDYITSENFQPVLKSNEFQNGLLMVQDQSQALPVYLLNPPVGSTVLDLCSAPGGKTIAIADKIGPKGKVVAIDSNPERQRLLEQNVLRVGFENVEIICADILKSVSDRKFHYIMLDVPCSALGTINHNPDLKWTRTEKDIIRQAKIQRRLLEKSASFLEIGGKLVYSTCSMEEEEIENVVVDFVNANGNFILDDMNNEFTSKYNTGKGIYRTWPHRHKIGGGGFAVIRKAG
jgi:16S rRNA (cytosine967-C5)-methyltransferase